MLHANLAAVRLKQYRWREDAEMWHIINFLVPNIMALYQIIGAMRLLVPYTTPETELGCIVTDCLTARRAGDDHKTYMGDARFLKMVPHLEPRLLCHQDARGC